MKKLVFIILTIFLFVPSVGEAKKKNNLRSVFRGIYEKSSWAVEGTDFDDIISPFGPRYYSSRENNFDWHRGLDISADEGANVLSVKKGTFWEYDTYSGAGKTVIIRYEFPEITRFQGKKLKYYYVYYMHLSDVPKKIKKAKKNSNMITIKKGQTIGYVGQTGNASGPHLHLEVRVGTPWSLETQNYYPSSAYYMGFDPAVNPMMFYEPLDKNMNLNITQAPTKKKRGIIEYTSSDDQPLFNRAKLVIKNKKTKKIVKKFNLNYNKRTNFDASSTTNLDTPDKSKPNISPSKYCIYGENFYTNIVIPKKYIKKYIDDKYKIKLTVYDIWGRKKKINIQN